MPKQLSPLGQLAVSATPPSWLVEKPQLPSVEMNDVSPAAVLVVSEESVLKSLGASGLAGAASSEPTLRTKMTSAARLARILRAKPPVDGEYTTRSFRVKLCC